MRCAISQIRNLILAALLLAAPAFAQTPQPGVEMSLPQARDLASYALGHGQPEVALRVAGGLVLADPRDGLAHYIRAAALAQLNRPDDGRKAAARAYRFATAGPDRLRAAELAARLAHAGGHPTLAQIWLRRTAIHATGARDEKQIARDYQALRRQNPWSFALRTDLRPSSNVNNGSESSVNIINGVPDSGTVTPSSQALSGVTGAVDLNAGYRLRASRTSATTLSGRLYLARAALSSSSKARAPAARNSDFSSDYAEISLNHAFAAGPPDAGGSAGLTFTLGESRYGGRRTYRLARLEGERSWRLAPDTGLRLSLLGEHRFSARSRANEAQVLSLGADLVRSLSGGSRLSLALALRDTRAELSSGTYRSATLRAAYAFGRALGPAKVTAGFSLGYSDYPLAYAGQIGFQPVFVPRSDRSAYFDVTFFFADFDYAGFAPALRLRAGRSKSNISLFSSRELSVSLGIQSKF